MFHVTFAKGILLIHEKEISIYLLIFQKEICGAYTLIENQGIEYYEYSYLVQYNVYI